MPTEIEVYAGASLPDRWNYAMAMASAGELVPKGMRTGGQPDAGKIFFTFETGSMLNIHPVAAIQGVNVIDGKPTLSPALMSAVIRRAGHKIRVTVTGQMADLSLTATAELVRHDDPDHPFVAVWTIEKAQRAGLLTVVAGKVVAKVGRNQESGVWEKYTEAMLKARAIGEVCREGGTDALMGIGYMPEELGANVNELGELIQVEAQDDLIGRRPAPQAADYRPIALVPDATGQPQGAPVAPQGAPVTEVYPETDMEMVAAYGLENLTSSEDCREAFMLAQQNGHLDRRVEGKPLGMWLQDTAENFSRMAAQLAAENVEEAAAV